MAADQMQLQVVDCEEEPVVVQQQQQLQDGREPSQKNKTNTGAFCPCCYESLTADAVAISQCRHTYHHQCLLAWFTVSRKQGHRPGCPLCRVPCREEDLLSILLSSGSDPPPVLPAEENEADARLHAKHLRQLLNRETHDKIATQTALEKAKNDLQKLQEEAAAAEQQHTSALAQVLGEVQQAERRLKVERDEAHAREETLQMGQRLLMGKLQEAEKEKQQLLLSKLLLVNNVGLSNEEIHEKMLRLRGLTTEEKLKAQISALEFCKRDRDRLLADNRIIKEENRMLRTKLLKMRMLLQRVLKGDAQAPSASSIAVKSSSSPSNSGSRGGHNRSSSLQEKSERCLTQTEKSSSKAAKKRSLPYSSRSCSSERDRAANIWSSLGLHEAVHAAAAELETRPAKSRRSSSRGGSSSSRRSSESRAGRRSRGGSSSRHTSNRRSSSSRLRNRGDTRSSSKGSRSSRTPRSSRSCRRAKDETCIRREGSSTNVSSRTQVCSNWSRKKVAAAHSDNSRYSPAKISRDSSCCRNSSRKSSKEASSAGSSNSANGRLAQQETWGSGAFELATGGTEKLKNLFPQGSSTTENRRSLEQEDEQEQQSHEQADETPKKEKEGGSGDEEESPRQDTEGGDEKEEVIIVEDEPLNDDCAPQRDCSSRTIRGFVGSPGSRQRENSRREVDSSEEEEFEEGKELHEEERRDRSAEKRVVEEAAHRQPGEDQLVLEERTGRCEPSEKHKKDKTSTGGLLDSDSAAENAAGLDSAKTTGRSENGLSVERAAFLSASAASPLVPFAKPPAAASTEGAVLSPRGGTVLPPGVVSASSLSSIDASISCAAEAGLPAAVSTSASSLRGAAANMTAQNLSVFAGRQEIGSPPSAASTSFAPAAASAATSHACPALAAAPPLFRFPSGASSSHYTPRSFIPASLLAGRASAAEPHQQQDAKLLQLHEMSCEEQRLYHPQRERRQAGQQQQTLQEQTQLQQIQQQPRREQQERTLRQWQTVTEERRSPEQQQQVLQLTGEQQQTEETLVSVLPHAAAAEKQSAYSALAEGRKSEQGAAPGGEEKGTEFFDSSNSSKSGILERQPQLRCVLSRQQPAERRVAEGRLPRSILPETSVPSWRQRPHGHVRVDAPGCIIGFTSSYASLRRSATQ